MKIGFKSDIHLDFWIGSETKDSIIEKFIEEKLSPKKMDVLILAGDLGHFNEQNVKLIKALKRYAEVILIVFGNHDYYLITQEQFLKYKNSFNRIKEFKRALREINGVFVLEGEVFNINGISFLGTGGWYDFSYAIKHGYSLEYIQEVWDEIMNDAKKIVPKINPVNFSLLEKEKLRKNINRAEIVFTHVPPLYISCHGDVIMDSFYSFYGYDLFTDNIKYWIFGHCHKPYDFYEGHIRFLSSPLGYPYMRTGKFNIDYLNYKER